MGRLTNPSGRTRVSDPLGPRSEINPVAFGKNIRVDDEVTPRPADNGDSLDDFIQELLNRPSATPVAILQELFDRTREISFNAARSWANVGSGETGANYGRILLVDRGGGPTTYGSRAYIDMQPVVQTVGAGGLFNAGMLWVIPNAADRSRLRASILNADGSLHQVIGADHMREVPSSISVTAAPADTTTLWTATSDTHPSPMGNLAEGATGRIQLSAHTPVWDGLLKDFPQDALTAVDALKLLRVKADHSGYELATLAVVLSAILPALASGDAGKQLTVNSGETGYELITRLAAFLSILSPTAGTDDRKLISLNADSSGLELVARNDVGRTSGIPVPTVDDVGDVVGVDPDGDLALIPAIAGGITATDWITSGDIQRGDSVSDGYFEFSLTDEATAAGCTLASNRRSFNIPQSPPADTYMLQVVMWNDEREQARVTIPYRVGTYPIPLHTSSETESDTDRTVEFVISNVIGQAWDEAPYYRVHVQDLFDRDDLAKRMRVAIVHGSGGQPGAAELQDRIADALDADVAHNPSAAHENDGGYGTLADGSLGWYRRLTFAELAVWDRMTRTDPSKPDHFWGTNDEGVWQELSKSELGGYTLQEWATIAVPANYHTDGDGITNASWVQTADGIASSSLIAAESSESYAIYLRNTPAIDGVFTLMARLTVGDTEVDRVIFPWGGVRGRDDQALSLSYQDSQFSYLFHLRASKLANEFHNWRLSLLGGNTGADANTVIHLDAIVNYTGDAAQSQIDARIRAAGIVRSNDIDDERVLTRAEFEALTPAPRTLYLFSG